VKQPYVKKQFIVTWSPQAVKVSCERLTLSEECFFDGTLGSNIKTMIVPEGIRYKDLAGFIGMKTKVTIEVEPW
jgi:hypothetical protein